MITSRTQAKDAMMTLLKTVTDAQSLHTIWEDVDKNTLDQKPDTSVPFSRIAVRHRAGGSTSLPNSAGRKKFQEDGFILIEIYTPSGDGTVTADTLAQAFLTALRTRSSLNQSVWYTDVRAQEIGQDDGWFKTNVVAEFHYNIIE